MVITVVCKYKMYLQQGTTQKWVPQPFTFPIGCYLPMCLPFFLTSPNKLSEHNATITPTHIPHELKFNSTHNCMYACIYVHSYGIQWVQW